MGPRQTHELLVPQACHTSETAGIILLGHSQRCQEIYALCFMCGLLNRQICDTYFIYSGVRQVLFACCVKETLNERASLSTIEKEGVEYLMIIYS